MSFPPRPPPPPHHSFPSQSTPPYPEVFEEMAFNPTLDDAANAPQQQPLLPPPGNRRYYSNAELVQVLRSVDHRASMRDPSSLLNTSRHAHHQRFLTPPSSTQLYHASSEELPPRPQNGFTPDVPSVRRYSSAEGLQLATENFPCFHSPDSLPTSNSAPTAGRVSAAAVFQAEQILRMRKNQASSSYGTYLGPSPGTGLIMPSRSSLSAGSPVSPLTATASIPSAHSTALSMSSSELFGESQLAIFSPSLGYRSQSTLSSLTLPASSSSLKNNREQPISHPQQLQQPGSSEFLQVQEYLALCQRQLSESLQASSSGSSATTNSHVNVVSPASPALSDFSALTDSSPVSGPTLIDPALASVPAEAGVHPTEPPKKHKKKKHRKGKKKDDGPPKAPVDPTRYKTHLCRNYELKGSCSYGDVCVYAHGLKELRSIEGNTSAVHSLSVLAEQLKAKMGGMPLNILGPMRFHKKGKDAPAVTTTTSGASGPSSSMSSLPSASSSMPNPL